LRWQAFCRRRRRGRSTGEVRDAAVAAATRAIRTCGGLIGRRYLAARPAEGFCAVARGALLGAGALDVPSDRNLAEIRHRLRTFGWPISGQVTWCTSTAGAPRTEARLMALVAMCANADAC
jgi:hypothetical protein